MKPQGKGRKMPHMYEVIGHGNITLEMDKLESAVVGAFNKARHSDIYRMGTERGPKILMASRRDGETVYINKDCELRIKKQED